MRKILTFFVGVCMTQCRMQAGIDDLCKLSQGYSWTFVYKMTVEKVNEYLNQKIFCRSNMDEIALWAFWRNKHSLVDFLNSEIFINDKEGKYELWLKNIFRSACRTAAEVDRTFQSSERYYELLKNNNNIKDLVDLNEFVELNDEIIQILEDDIDWGD